jgi:hypothetical protein
MTIKRNLFIGAAISALVASTLFSAGRKSNPKPQTGWNREQWLRLLSGANSSSPVQPGQASQRGASAEIIGRTGYPLYR